MHISLFILDAPIWNDIYSNSVKMNLSKFIKYESQKNFCKTESYLYHQ